MQNSDVCRPVCKMSINTDCLLYVDTWCVSVGGVYTRTSSFSIERNKVYLLEQKFTF